MKKTIRLSLLPHLTVNDVLSTRKCQNPDLKTWSNGRVFLVITFKRRSLLILPHFDAMDGLNSWSKGTNLSRDSLS